MSCENLRLLGLHVPGGGVVSGPPSSAALLSCERPSVVRAFPQKSPGQGGVRVRFHPRPAAPGAVPPGQLLSERFPGGRETGILSQVRVTCHLRSLCDWLGRAPVGPSCAGGSLRSEKHPLPFALLLVGQLPCVSLSRNCKT